MIQEECNRLSEESDDELSATIDDQSEKNYLDDAEAMLDRRNNNEESEEDGGSDNEELGSMQANSVFGKIDLFLDNVNLNQKGSGRSRSEGWTFSDCESESPRHQEKILDQQGFARNKQFLVSIHCNLAQWAPINNNMIMFHWKYPSILLLIDMC